MATQENVIVAFNRGVISKLALARQDVKPVTLGAEESYNWMPRVLGAMSLRAGWKYLGATASNAAARFLPFIFSTSDTSLVEFTTGAMRVWIQDALLTRASVSAAVTNGTFSGNITGWTDGSDAGGAIAWVAGNYLGITGSGTARGIARQAVTVAAAEQVTEHALRIVVARGPVTFQVGTTTTTDDLVGNTVLATGSHSIAFTPGAGTFYIQFQSTAAYVVLVQSCTVESAGVVSITSPYLAADLGNIRGGPSSQSGDVIYLACAGYQQRRIERRGTRPYARSWSLCVHAVDDGPFRTENFGPVTITPSATTGDISLTASRDLFQPLHVGALFYLTANSAQQTVTAAAENTFTSTSIKVTGTGTQRQLTVTITGTWVATVMVQQSIGVDGVWTDFAGYTTNQASVTLSDGLDNQIVYYRIGIKTGGYTSGTATCQLNYANGSQTGVARITSYQTRTLVSAQVLSQLGGTSATKIWAEGQWSDYRGWPTAVALAEGRLWWTGKGGIWGSVSDGYSSMDPNFLGDAGPISRTVGSGPVDTINWAAPLSRIVLGGEGEEITIRSSDLNEPLTPTNFNLKAASTQGSAAVQGAKVDDSVVFVQRGGVRVFQLSPPSANSPLYEFAATHLTALCPEIGKPGISRLAVQRQPDTRIHCVRTDGVVSVCVIDALEGTIGWVNLDTSGTVEDVVVLPAASGTSDDAVYYVVKRTINGATVRYLERWALEDDCIGGTLNKQADAFVTYEGTATSTITGLSHLEAATVVVWGDGSYLGTATVSGGQITVPGGGTVSNAVVGLSYTARYTSGKLLQLLTRMGTALSQKKAIRNVGLIMANVYASGLQYGQDSTYLRDLPGIEGGAAVSSTAVRTSYDEQMIPMPASWSTDSRLYLQAVAPKPVTVLAAVMECEFHAN